jgi:hypothetical protein
MYCGRYVRSTEFAHLNVTSANRLDCGYEKKRPDHEYNYPANQIVLVCVASHIL